MKKAMDKLRQINWLYEDVADDAVDDSTEQVIEEINSTTSSMLENNSWRVV